MSAIPHLISSSMPAMNRTHCYGFFVLPPEPLLPEPFLLPLLLGEPSLAAAAAGLAGADASNGCTPTRMLA
jgi:hypothetical protein